MVDQLNELKKQEDILKNLINKLEDQKQRLQIEESDLVNLLEKSIKSATSINPLNISESTTTLTETTTLRHKETNNDTAAADDDVPRTTLELNLDPNLKFSTGSTNTGSSSSLALSHAKNKGGLVEEEEEEDDDDEN